MNPVTYSSSFTGFSFSFEEFAEASSDEDFKYKIVQKMIIMLKMIMRGKTKWS
jgi:hypothetical protein